MSGSVIKGKGDSSQSLQMIERPLMTLDELKSMPKGNFIVMKTGSNPMKSKLELFTKWGISFEESYSIKDNSQQQVKYLSKTEILKAVTTTPQIQVTEQKEKIKLE